MPPMAWTGGAHQKPQRRGACVGCWMRCYDLTKPDLRTVRAPRVRNTVRMEWADFKSAPSRARRVGRGWIYWTEWHPRCRCWGLTPQCQQPREVRSRGRRRTSVRRWHASVHPKACAYLA